ncbi:MAG: response regulator, partial [Clostridiales bacterium]|nr:response regulator [Clostridiales bacterium]
MSIIQLIRKLIDPSLPVQIIGEAQDGVSAYEMICQQQPDIVITDIRMPGLNGIELIEKVRLTKRDVCFILVSGYSDFEYARNAIRLGVMEYLVKPIQQSDLNQLLERICASREETDNRKKHMEHLRERLMTDQGSRRQEFLMDYINYVEGEGTAEERVRADAPPLERDGLPVKQVKEYLAEHLDEEVNLEKIAAKIGLSSTYVSTLFRKETGVTITNYLIQLRIEKAKKLIRE